MTAAAVRAARSPIRRCQRAPRTVRVSGWVHGTASWIVTTSGCGPTRRDEWRRCVGEIPPARCRTQALLPRRSQGSSRQRKASGSEYALDPRRSEVSMPGRPALDAVLGTGRSGERPPQLDRVPPGAAGNSVQALLDDESDAHGYNQPARRSSARSASTIRATMSSKPRLGDQLEPSTCLARIPHENGGVRRPNQRRIHAYQRLPVGDTHARERGGDEVSDGMVVAGCDDVVIRLRMAQRPHHGVDVVGRPAPIASGVQVAQRERISSPERDLCNSSGDLS